MERKESYGKYVWRMWYPVLLKFAIAYMASLFATIALTAFYVVRQDPEDMELLAEEMMTSGKLEGESAEFMEEMQEDVLEQYMNYAVLIEGAAALMTIPVMLLFFYLDRRKERREGVLFVQYKPPLWQYAAIPVFAGTMGLGLNNLMILANLSSLSNTYVETMEVFYEPSLPIQIICLVILIPISEELVFRGLVYRRMRLRSTFMYAALYSTLIFSFTHMNLVQFVYAFLMGMMLAWLYEKYGSVKAPILGHVAANLVSVLATEYQLFDWLLEEPMRMGIVTTGCAAVASSMFVLTQRIEPGEEKE